MINIDIYVYIYIYIHMDMNKSIYIYIYMHYNKGGVQRAIPATRVRDTQCVTCDA